MALLRCESFDHYDDGYEHAKFGYTQGSTVYIAASGGRRGGGALDTTYNSSVHGWIKIGADVDTVIVGFSMRSTSVGNYEILDLYDDQSTKQVSIYRSANDGKITANNGDSTELDETAEVVFSQNVACYVEVKFVIHDTAGSVEVRVDGTTVLNLTNQDTRNGTPTTANTLRFGPFMYIDDLYILDTTGSTNNDFLGDVKVVAVLPDSDGTHTDFTPSTGVDHYAVVDDPNTNQSDYVDGDTLNDIDTYGITAPSGLGAVYGIQVGLYAQNPDAGTRGIKSVVRSGGTDYLSTDETTLSDSWQFALDVRETDPDDSNAWTESKLNAAEFGIKITA